MIDLLIEYVYNILTLFILRIRCESLVLSHGIRQIIFGVSNNTTEKLFADGVGRKDDFEIVIMESSGPFLVENIGRSVDDTWKDNHGYQFIKK